MIRVFQNFLKLQGNVKENVCLDKKTFDSKELSYIEFTKDLIMEKSNIRPT